MKYRYINIGIVAYNIAKSGVWDTVKFPQTLTNAIPLLARFQAKIDGWEAARLRSDAGMFRSRLNLENFRGLYLYTGGVLFHVEWCIR